MIFWWIVLTYIFKRVWPCFGAFKFMLCFVFVVLYYFWIILISLSVKRGENWSLHICTTVHTPYTLLQYKYVTKDNWIIVSKLLHCACSVCYAQTDNNWIRSSYYTVGVYIYETTDISSTCPSRTEQEGTYSETGLSSFPFNNFMTRKPTIIIAQNY